MEAKPVPLPEKTLIVRGFNPPPLECQKRLNSRICPLYYKYLTEKKASSLQQRIYNLRTHSLKVSVYLQ